ncbi:MAG: hypothetical protein EA391_05850 [Balneolaceae bacterium]|nr:MAG: hypothetical protein EA391_05850 [Balneolaceae bacterium]
MEKEEKNINFTKEAFLHPVNLVCLLVAMVSALVLNDVGLAPNAILAFAFGMELIYLGIVPRLPSYQKNIRLKKEKEEQQQGSNEKQIFYRLDAKSQKRFLVLKHITKEVKKNFDTLPYTSKGMLEHIQNKMDDLLSTYLNLLEMHRRYEMYMNSEVEDEIRRDVKLQESKLNETDSEKLLATGKRRLSILNKRLKKFDTAKEKYLITETHLDTIEDAIRYIYEQSMTMPNADDVGHQLDHLLSEVEETTTVIEELEYDMFPGMEEMDKELKLAELKKDAEKLHTETEKKVRKPV